MQTKFAHKSVHCYDIPNEILRRELGLAPLAVRRDELLIRSWNRLCGIKSDRLLGLVFRLRWAQVRRGEGALSWLNSARTILRKYDFWSEWEDRQPCLKGDKLQLRARVAVATKLSSDNICRQLWAGRPDMSLYPDIEGPVGFKRYLDAVENDVGVSGFAVVPPAQRLDGGGYGLAECQPQV